MIDGEITLAQWVFPTRVGVDLEQADIALSSSRFPHTRGGGPAGSVVNLVSAGFSPHAWGWTD